MPRYIALLGGINVCGHTVKMADLRRLFEEQGFTDVTTFIASGNVLFDTPRADRNTLETELEAHFKTSPGYAVPTLLRTPDELASAAAYWPFDATDKGTGGVSLYVTFLKQAVEPELELHD